MSEVWDHVDVASEGRFPWPPPEGGSIVAALGQTWKSATFDPAAFFRDVPGDRGTGAALLYYLGLGIVVAGATLFWRTLDFYAGRMASDSLAAELGIHALNPLVGFLLSPAILLASLALSAGIVHVLLLLFSGGDRGFGTTVRVFCYAYSPMLFAVVPLIGALIGSVWMVVLLVVGLREAHRADGWKPLLAVLLPFFVLVILVFLALVLLVAAASTLMGS